MDKELRKADEAIVEDAKEQLRAWSEAQAVKDAGAKEEALGERPNVGYDPAVGKDKVAVSIDLNGVVVGPEDRLVLTLRPDAVLPPDRLRDLVAALEGAGIPMKRVVLLDGLDVAVVKPTDVVAVNTPRGRRSVGNFKFVKMIESDGTLRREFDYRGRRVEETITALRLEGRTGYRLAWRDVDDPRDSGYVHSFYGQPGGETRMQETSRRRVCEAYERDYFGDVKRVGLRAMTVTGSDLPEPPGKVDGINPSTGELTVDGKTYQQGPDRMTNVPINPKPPARPCGYCNGTGSIKVPNHEHEGDQQLTCPVCGGRGSR